MLCLTEDGRHTEMVRKNKGSQMKDGQHSQTLHYGAGENDSLEKTQRS